MLKKDVGIDATAAGLKAAQDLGIDTKEEEEVEIAEMATAEEGVKEEAKPEAEEVVEAEEEELAKGKRVTHVPLQRFNEVYREKKELERLLTQLVGQVDRLVASPPASKKVVEEEKLPNFDTMTNAEMMSWNLKRQDSLRNDIISAVREEVGQLGASVQAKDVAADIRQTAAKHKDYKDYLPQMITLADKHPTLSAEEVYLLASGNTGAVKKSVLQRTKDLVEKKKAARTETRSSPTETSTEKKEYKTVREAGLAAARKMGLIS